MKTILTLISLCLLALSSTVFADGDNYTAANGNGCDNASVGEAELFGRNQTGIHNTSSSARYVTCPIDKDSVSNTGGLGTTWVRWSGAGTMTCYLYAWDVNGNSLGYKIASGGPGWFSIPPLAGDDFYGSNSMLCSVPAYAYLENYHYFEY